MNESDQDKTTVELGGGGGSGARPDSENERLGSLLEEALQVSARPTDLNQLPDIGNRNRFIAGYEILNELPRAGGMGVVYKARQLELGRVVALKMLLQPRDETARKRFFKEARAIASLKHDNIIKVLDFGEIEGRPFFTMEYIEKNLADHVRARAMEPKDAARCVEDLAHAIQAAHEHENGVLHRDLKPSNILVDPQGKFLVADFGLAKAVTPGKEESITLPERGVGTPNYMAPEQITGDACPQSDIYALGGILYFLLASRAPFLGSSDVETLLLVKSTEPIAPSQLNPRVSPDLEAVCLKCLEKNPSARYGSAKELAEDLRRYRNDEPTVARPVGPLGRLVRLARRNPRDAALIAVIAAVLLAGAIVSTLFYFKADESRAQFFEQYQRAQILRANDAAAAQKLPDALALLAQVVRLNPTNVLAAERLLYLLTHRALALPVSAPMSSGEFILQKRFSADGKKLLVLSTDAEGQRQVWLWAPDEGTMIRRSNLPGGNPLRRAAISPDLQNLALVESGPGEQTIVIRRVATLEVLSRIALSNTTVRLLSFGEDGRSLCFLQDDGHVQTWQSGSSWQQAFPLSDSRLEHWTSTASIVVDLSDGGRVLATADAQNIRVWDAISGRSLALFAHGHGFVPKVAFGPGGSRLVSYDPGLGNKSSELCVWDWRSAKSLCAIREPERIQGICLNAEASRLAVVGQMPHVVKLWDLGTTNILAEPISCPASPPIEAMFCPDATRLLIMTKGSMGSFNLLTHANRGHELALKEWPSPPAPLPSDGRGWPPGRVRDRFMERTAGRDISGKNGPLVYWRIPSQGPPVKSLGPVSDVNHAVLSRSGKRLALARKPAADSPSRNTNDSVEIWDLPRERLLQSNLVHQLSVMDLAFNAEGTRLVTADQQARFQFWILQSNSASRATIADSNSIHQAHFARDGSHVLTSDYDGKFRVWNLASTNPPTLLHTGDETIRLAAISPDGCWAITAVEPEQCRVWNLQTSRCIVTQAVLPRVSHLAFSPDSSFAVVASGDEEGWMQRWRIPSNGEAPTARRLGHKVTDFTFSQDGRKLLVSGGAFASIHDAVTLEMLGAPLEHQPKVQQAIFSQDGERIATVANDGTAIVWNAPSRAPITDRIPTGLSTTVGILFDDTGQRLIVFGTGGARMLDIPRTGPTSPSWLPELAEAVAGQRFQGADVAQPILIEQFERVRLTLSASAPTADPLIRWAQRFVGKPTARSTDLPSPEEK